jgi:hypothetical protein
VGIPGENRIRPAQRLPWGPNRLSVALLNLMVRILYGRTLTDEATCYKAIRTDVVRRRPFHLNQCSGSLSIVSSWRLPLVSGRLAKRFEPGVHAHYSWRSRTRQRSFPRPGELPWFWCSFCFILRIRQIGQHPIDGRNHENQRRFFQCVLYTTPM